MKYKKDNNSERFNKDCPKCSGFLLYEPSSSDTPEYMRCVNCSLRLFNSNSTAFLIFPKFQRANNFKTDRWNIGGFEGVTYR